nr:hypothetical protein CFP56_50157 [Quercus suber]
MKDETPVLKSLFGTPSSSIPSFEMMTFSPSTMHSKGKAKIGKSVWDGPTTALERAHNVITDDEFKGLSFIPSHELVLGGSLHLTTDYLSGEEKVVVANSKVDFVEAESSRLRKDLIEAMDQLTKAKKKVKELKEALKVEKKLIIQKDKEVQAAFLRTDKKREKFKQYFKGFEVLRHWMMKHHSHVADFAKLDFEAVDIEILVDEANEKEGETIGETTEVVEEEGTVIRGANDEAQIEVNCMEKTVNAP